ncbi:ImmA/IrrE family metallo-endopeptidase [Nostoc sp.]|uniref:ImmA/IrrE family metallo-endopeptidase n=1 Tax=Nostoc sp. TaxID=1180 RepID=UPI002FFB4B0D
MIETTRTFIPDWVSPPGDAIADLLEEPDWTQLQLADRWSREFLIPPEYEGELAKLKYETDVIDFAERIGIHPGIVVGRLQNDRLINPSWMNDLKVSLHFQEIESV